VRRSIYDKHVIFELRLTTCNIAVAVSCPYLDRSTERKKVSSITTRYWCAVRVSWGGRAVLSTTISPEEHVDLADALTGG
jgi:hypothetical protein